MVENYPSGCWRVLSIDQKRCLMRQLSASDGRLSAYSLKSRDSASSAQHRLSESAIGLKTFNYLFNNAHEIEGSTYHSPLLRTPN